MSIVSPAARGGYRSAADGFVGAVEAVPPAAWDAPALGEWSGRELVGHTLRALTTVEEYLDAGVAAPTPTPPTPPTLGSLEDYYALALPAGQEGLHAAVAARGREAGAELTDPVGTVRATVARVLARVDDTADDAVCATRFGTIALIDYLPTRVMELVVHTLDLARATGVPAPIDPEALEVALVVLARQRPGSLEPAVLALAERAPLPEGFGVLGAGSAVASA